VHVNVIKISNEFLSFVGAKWLWYEMTASTDYVPLLLNYFPLFVIVCRAVGDVCRGLCQIARRFVRMPTGAWAEETKQQCYAIAGKVITNHNK
jgi:hypothetical protein